MRRLHVMALAAAIALASVATTAHAQALGPFRQFLAIEPYYERTSLDNGDNADKLNFNGYGARLWINLEPFHFIPHGSIALHGSYAPSQNQSTNGNTTLRTFGVEYNQFLMHRPLGGVIDPFLSAGYSRVRVKETAGTVTLKESYNALPVGGGIRIPLPNRFELRGDAKDLILFKVPSGTTTGTRTTNNLLLQAALGITF